MKVVADLGDFPPAEILVAAVVVQAEDGGQPAGRTLWLEENGLGRWAVRQLPAQVFG